MGSSAKPFAIYHEHPDWFRPLFKELERRSLPVLKLDPRRHWFDPGSSRYNFSLLFNRMSPSAYLRDGVQGTFFTLNYLAHLESLGIPVVNGHKAFTYEISKALQLNLLKRSACPSKSRVINHASSVGAAGYVFIVVKASVGGSKRESFALIRGSPRGCSGNRLNFGIDHPWCRNSFPHVQHRHPCRDLGQRHLRHQDPDSRRYVQPVPG